MPKLPRKIKKQHLETDGIGVSLNTEKPISSNRTKTQLHIEFVCGTTLKHWNIKDIQLMMKLLNTDRLKQIIMTNEEKVIQILDKHYGYHVN